MEPRAPCTRARATTGSAKAATVVCAAPAPDKKKASTDPRRPFPDVYTAARSRLTPASISALSMVNVRNATPPITAASPCTGTGTPWGTTGASAKAAEAASMPTSAVANTQPFWETGTS